MKKDVHKNNRGSIAIIVAISLTVLIGILAIVIDGGWLYASKNKWQNGVEAAAMAGALDICGDDFEAAARQIAQENGLPFTAEEGLTVQVGYYDANNKYEEDLSVYKDFVADDDDSTDYNEYLSDPGNNKYEFNNAVMVSLNAEVSTFLAGILGKDRVSVKAKAVGYLTNYGLLALGEDENEGVKIEANNVNDDFWKTTFKNGDIHANEDVEFTYTRSGGYIEGIIDQDTVIVSAHGSVTGIDFGIDGADTVKMKSIEDYVDELAANADHIYTEDDFPGVGEEISVDGNILGHTTCFYGSLLYFTPHECEHGGRIYYFNLSESYKFGIIPGKMEFNNCNRITNLIVATNAATLCLSTAGHQQNFLGGGGHVFQFATKNDIGFGGPYNMASRMCVKFDGVLLIGENVYLDQSGGFYPGKTVVKMIAGRTIDLAPNTHLATAHFDFGPMPPCPPINVKLGKLEPSGT